jgi:hypothetical protein
LHVVEFVVVLAVLAAVVWLVSAPLRRGPSEQAPGAEVGQLEAAREAKYREIRDAELDFATGKLSERDYREIDGALRAEAIEILRRLDAARDAGGGPDGR